MWICREVALLVEVVMDLAMKGGEFLQRSHAPEAQHRPLSSSERLVTVLEMVVQLSASFAFADGAEGFECRTVRCKPIGDDDLGLTVPPQ